MSRRGKEITSRVTSAIKEINRGDDLYYGKQNTLNRIATVCSFYEFGDNCKLCICDSWAGLIFFRGNTKYSGVGTVIKIPYGDFRMAYISYGAWEAEFLFSYSNLLEIIEFVDKYDNDNFLHDVLQRFVNDGLVTSVRYIGDNTL